MYFIKRTNIIICKNKPKFKHKINEFKKGILEGYFKKFRFSGKFPRYPQCVSLEEDSGFMRLRLYIRFNNNLKIKYS